MDFLIKKEEQMKPNKSSLLSTAKKEMNQILVRPFGTKATIQQCNGLVRQPSKFMHLLYLLGLQKASKKK
jgi:hypothetical protein